MPVIYEGHTLTKEYADLDVLLAALPQSGRLIASLRQYLVNNAVFCLDDYAVPGLVPDGTNDYTPALTRLLSFMPAVGGRIVFGTGTYLFSPVVLPAFTGGLVMEGQHRKVSIVKAKAGQLDNLFKSTCDIEYTRLKFDGNAAANAAEANRWAMLLHNGNTGDLLVHHCWFTQTTHAAIRLDQINGTVSIHHNVFKDLSDWPSTGTTAQGSYGIYGSSTFASSGSLSITHNAFVNGAPAGGNTQPCGFQMDFNPAGLASIDVSHNYLDHFGGNRGGTQPSGPLDVYQFADRATYSFNRIKNSGCGGIRIGNTNNLTVIGNVITDDTALNTAAAIFVGNFVRTPATDYHNVVISGNIVRNWTAGYGGGVGPGNGIGIHIFGGATALATTNAAKRWTIADNICDNVVRGLWIEGTGDVNLDNNLVSTSALYAVVLQNVAGTVAIRGGQLLGSTQQAIFGDTGLDNLKLIVDGVTFEGYGTYAIRLIDPTYTADLVAVKNCNFLTPAVASMDIERVAVVEYKNNTNLGTAPAFVSCTSVVRFGNTDDLLTGTAVYDPPNLVDGAGASTTVTVTGAALGDFASQVSFSLDLQGITVTAYVSAPNTVTVRFQNESGGAVDLASGTLTARVLKK